MKRDYSQIEVSKNHPVDCAGKNSNVLSTSCRVRSVASERFVDRLLACETTASPNKNPSADRIAINCTSQRTDKFCAINCNSESHFQIGLSKPVRDFISQSLSPATKRAYATDMAHFAASGRHLPASPNDVAEYLAEMAGAFAVATIQRRLVSVSKAHRALGADDPAQSELVKATMRGIRRTYGVAQRQAAALLRDDLFAMLDKLGDRPKDVRDRALLLLGFATAMRRSEIAALDVRDVEFVPRGMLVRLRRSKTDQEGRGRTIAVPFGRTRHCPIAALKAWLELADRREGPIFTTLDKHGHMFEQRISGEAVSHVVKTRIAAAGYDPSTFSGHSLRAGFATSAAQAGASTYKIRQITGHRSEASLSRYVRDTGLFTDNAAARVL